MVGIILFCLSPLGKPDLQEAGELPLPPVSGEERTSGFLGHSDNQSINGGYSESPALDAHMGFGGAEVEPVTRGWKLVKFFQVHLPEGELRRINQSLQIFLHDNRCCGWRGALIEEPIKN